MSESDNLTSHADPLSRPQTVLGVALDMDGLLFDTERLYWQVGDTVLQRRGHRFSEALQRRMMGRVGVASMQEMIDFHQLDVAPESLLVECDELFGDLLSEGLRPMPGLSQWIQRLTDSAVPFGLATSSRRKFVTTILNSVDWSERLSFVLTGDDVTRGKPDPQIYQMAAAKMSIPAARMLVLEDSENGCAAAVAAGAVTVAVPSEHTVNQDFSGAVLVAESLLDPRLHRFL